MPAIVIVLIVMGLGFIAQKMVGATVEKYSAQKPTRGLTGEQAAREILDTQGLHEVQIEEATFGQLSDHYDPEKRVLRLSKEVGPVVSIAAVGIAAHEVGHAIQHAENYPPLMQRSSLAPKIALGTRLLPYVFWGGIVVGIVGLPQLGVPLALFGTVLYVSVAAMAFITLPVEFDASARARKLLAQHKIVSRREMEGVSAVLNAAAWTYVISALSALIQLLIRRR